MSMQKRKNVLKFKKIKIANINFIKGGADTDDTTSEVEVCQSGNNCPPPPNEASVAANPCSDEYCFGGRTDESINQQICFRTF